MPAVKCLCRTFRSEKQSEINLQWFVKVIKYPFSVNQPFLSSKVWPGTSMSCSSVDRRVVSSSCSDSFMNRSSYTNEWSTVSSELGSDPVRLLDNTKSPR